LSRFGDAIRLIKHPRNRGAAASRNTGCDAASGDYIAFLDSDDRWLPGKLERQIAFMNEGGYDVSCTSYLLERSKGDVVVSPHYHSGPLGLTDLVWGCFVSPGSTLLGKRSVFQEVGALDVSLRRFEDWDWLMRFASTGRRLGFLAEPLARVEPSAGADKATVFAALGQIRERHLGRLSGQQRRNFKAAYHMERAAALLRSGSKASAASELAMSIGLSPWHHKALRAVLHNRFAAADRS
jgi:hypothetical protein